MAQLYSGTSGFAYPSWKPDFYPAKCPAKDFLQYYATRLNAVEINYTFRQLPKAAALENWVKATPEGFLFACKAHMRITHMHRLRESEFTVRFFEALELLVSARRLGPVLFQVPPNLKVNVALLAQFLEGIPASVRATFEFRHQSWFSEEIYRLLERHGAALCLAESDKLEVPQVITSDFVYARLRKQAYSRKSRREIAERVRQQLDAGRDVFVFFKHEDTPEGALYAEEIGRMV